MRNGMFCLALGVFLMGTLSLNAEDSRSWRSGWVNCKTAEDARLHAKVAKDVGVHALITAGAPEKIRAFSDAVTEEGVEAYWWLPPIHPPHNKSGDYYQQLPPDEAEAMKKQNKDPKAYEQGYQGGGEPLPGRKDYNMCLIACFHRAEVIEATKAAITETVAAAPRLTGVALDMWGYMNYKECVCAESERQFAEWRKEHSHLEDASARDAFALERLVSAQNEILNHIRHLNPALKTTVHVWPTYLKEPLYGNRLDLDYCCQTVAWFLEPYWSQEKIRDYTQRVISDAKKYHSRPVGIPFMGLFIGRGAAGDKSLTEFERELDIIFAADPARNLSIYDFSCIVKNPDYASALRKRLLPEAPPKGEGSN